MPGNLRLLDLRSSLLAQQIYRMELFAMNIYRVDAGSDTQYELVSSKVKVDLR